MRHRWPRIPGFPNYAISATGIVERATPGRSTYVGRRLKQCTDRDGYRYVCVDGKRRAVHKLVCLTFHGPRPSPKHEVAHRNGNLAWNHWRNLRWATRHENRMDAVRHRRTGRLGGGVPQKLDEAKVRAIRAIPRTVKREVVAAQFNISKSHVSDIRNFVRWSHVK